jgi:hypothetical protein
MLSFDLMVTVQSAYRANHSTEMALLLVMNDLLLWRRGWCSISAFGFSFDTIDHSVLLSCLEYRFGLKGVVLDWFRSSLSNRRQSVRISEESSTPSPLLLGVPQGSILGSVLFTMYLSPLYDIVSLFEVLHHYFADDTLLYKRFRILADGSAQCSAFSCLSDCVKSKIGILVPRRGQSRADGAVGTGESLRCPIASPYLNTLLIFILSDTSFFTLSLRSLWCVPFLYFGSFSTIRKFRRNCLCLFAAKLDSKILQLSLSSKMRLRICGTSV